MKNIKLKVFECNGDLYDYCNVAVPPSDVIAYIRHTNNLILCSRSYMGYYYLEDEDLCCTLDVIHLELRLSNDDEAQYFEIS